MVRIGNANRRYVRYAFFLSGIKRFYNRSRKNSLDEVPVRKLSAACRSSISVCVLVFAPTILFAQAQPSSNLASNPVYEKSCAKCHGKTAEGRFLGGPSLVSDSATSMSSGDLKNIITNGKGHMPKYSGKLSAEEIDTLVQQVKSSAKK
jgi:cytochrome c5